MCFGANALLACRVNVPCALGCTMCIILLNRLLKVWDVQSGESGVMMFNSKAGSGVGKQYASGVSSGSL